jgi:hypothetical protein
MRLASAADVLVSEAGARQRGGRRRGRRRVLLILAAGALILAALGVWLTISVRSLLADATASANQGRSAMVAGADLLKNGGFGLTLTQAEAAANDFRAAEKAFVLAQQRLTDPFLMRVFARLPLIGTQVQAARNLADMGIHVSRMGALGVIVVEAPLLEPAHTVSGNQDPGQKLLGLLDAVDPRLASLKQELHTVITDRQQIPASGLFPELSRAVAEFDSKINLQSVDAALTELGRDEAGLRALVGATGTRTYLVLQQDPAELRATGGFIGSVGFLSFNAGKMAPYDPMDIDRIDLNPNGSWVLGRRGTASHVDPPWPMEQTLHIQSWELRDANWSPDFPTTAKQAEFLLNRERGKKVDGVIAIDPFFIQRLLAITGPLKVPETGDTLDQNNFYALTFGRVEAPVAGRKDYLSFAAKQILARLLKLPPNKWFAVLQAIQTSCESGSLQASFHDQEAQVLSNRHHCGGQVESPPGDGLMIVETNVGGNKDDYWMRRSYSLQISVNPDGSARHTLRLHYDGLADHGFRLTGRWGYTGWLRIYLPASTTLVSVTGTKLDPADELGRRVLQGWFYVQFAHSADVTVVYDEGAAVMSADQHGIHVLWQKQAGRVADPISVDLRLPAGWKLNTARVGVEHAVDGPVKTDLAADRAFVFEYQSR